MPDYLAVTCRLAPRAEERLTAMMADWPVLGCQVEDSGTELAVTVFLAVGEAGSLDAVSAGLRSLGARDVNTGHYADQDWLAEFRRRVGPAAIGASFWVDPHPDRPTPAPDGRHYLLIEPRQAFGTGSHESTRLIILLLEDDPPKGAKVLDVGTGSGILALASRALGASWVVGFDIDLEATFVARQIVAEQPVCRDVALFCGTAAALRESPSFDVVLANLLPSQFEPLLGSLRRLIAPGGRLLLSGLMLDQRDAVKDELRNAGFAVDGAREQDEWAALCCRPGRAQARRSPGAAGVTPPASQ